MNFSELESVLMPGLVVVVAAWRYEHWRAERLTNAAKELLYSLYEVADGKARLARNKEGFITLIRKSQRPESAP